MTAPPNFAAGGSGGRGKARSSAGSTWAWSCARQGTVRTAPRAQQRQIAHTRRSQVTSTRARFSFSGEAGHVRAWCAYAQSAARCPAPAASHSSKTDRLRPPERLEQPPELPEQLLRPEARFHVEAAEAAAEGCPCGWPQPDRLAASLRPCAEPRFQQTGAPAAARRVRPAMAPPVAQPELQGGAGWGRREGWRQRPRPPQCGASWWTAPPRRLAGRPANVGKLAKWRLVKQPHPLFHPTVFANTGASW